MEATEGGDAADIQKTRKVPHRYSCSQGHPSLRNTEERLENVPQQGYFRHKGSFCTQAGASLVPSTDTKKLLDNSCNSEKTENIRVEGGG